MTVQQDFARGVQLDAHGSEFVVTREGRRLPVTLHPGGVRSAFAVSGSMPLEGAWTVDFPEGSGAPAQIVLDGLTDWKDHADPGVRYFSGTATYHKTFSYAKGTGRVWLDLGEVQNLAQVTLNGRDLGILWHAPFSVDVTDVLREGDNELEIRVTNLWVNRMVGDEFEPDDVVWGEPSRYSYAPGNPIIGSTMKEIPEWLEKNQPRPSQGRHAVISYKFFSQYAPLHPSGLLGPVVLSSGE